MDGELLILLLAIPIHILAHIWVFFVKDPFVPMGADEQWLADVEGEGEAYLREIERDDEEYFCALERDMETVDATASRMFEGANALDGLVRSAWGGAVDSWYRVMPLERHKPYPKEQLPARRGGYVYLIRDRDVTGYCKIGKSTNVRRRIGHFDTMLPFETDLLHIIETDDCTALEARLHRHFAEKRVRGEWFELDDNDIAAIKRLT